MQVDVTTKELAYLSRAIFRQRLDAPDDEPEVASSLDPKISIARIRADAEERDARPSSDLLEIVVAGMEDHHADICAAPERPCAHELALGELRKRLIMQEGLLK